MKSISFHLGRNFRLSLNLIIFSSIVFIGWNDYSRISYAASSGSAPNPTTINTVSPLAPVQILDAPCEVTRNSGAKGFLRDCSELMKDTLDDGKGVAKSLDNIAAYLYKYKVMPSPLDPALKGLSGVKGAGGVDGASMGCRVSTTPDAFSLCGAVNSKPFADQICSITPNRFNHHKSEGAANGNKNYLGEDCGNLILAHFHPDISCTSSPSDSTTTYQAKNGYGDRERSWVAGSFMQMLAFHFEKIRTSVKASNKLDVHGNCQAIAADLSDLGTTSTKVASQVTQNLSDTSNIKDIWNCDNKFEKVDAGKTDTTGIDVGALRQSAQHLCSARSNIEGVFGQLLICEVFSRAQEDFIQVFGVDLKKFSNALRPELSDMISNECQSGSECDGCNGTTWYGCPTNGSCESCGTNCGNKIYEFGKTSANIPSVEEHLRKKFLLKFETP